MVLSSSRTPSVCFRVVTLFPHKFTHTHAKEIHFLKEIEKTGFCRQLLSTHLHIYIYSKCVCVCVCVNKCFAVFCCVICADERRLLKTKQRERERERERET